MMNGLNQSWEVDGRTITADLSWNGSTEAPNNDWDPCLNDEGSSYETLEFWLDGVLEMGIGLVGLICNSMSIPILLSRRMKNIFSLLLICLATTDNIFILTCLLEVIRRYIINTNIHMLLFIYFFYQVQNIALMCSNNITVILAVERYLAVTRPIQYHQNVTVRGASSQWKRMAAYMIPTILFGIIFNIPKFFELRHSEDMQVQGTGPNQVNVTVINYQLTSLRLNNNYSLFYVHLSRMFITGIIPFSALIYLNISIYRAAISRHTTRNTTGSTSTDEGHHQSLTGEDRRMAIVLFSIVVLYMVCNTPRLILNFYEFFSIDLFRRNPNLCFRMPTWVEVMTSVNLVIITFNSSVNYFIYCACNTTFREEQSARWAAFKDKYFQNWPASLATLVTFGRGDQEDVQGGQAVAFSRRRTITNQGSGGGASSGIRVLHSHPDLGNDLENCVLMPPEQSGQKFREQGCQEPPP